MVSDGGDRGAVGRAPPGRRALGEKKPLTGTHMAGDMLGAGEGRLADRTFVVAGHGVEDKMGEASGAGGRK